jgi:hypothetical protein
MKKVLFIALAFNILYCPAQNIIINEIQASNTNTLADNMGDYDDWIELYNPTNHAIDIGGMVLKDNVDVWRIPQGKAETLIPAGGFFIIWADDEVSEGDFHTNFKLSSANGEFLGLYQPDSLTVIDSITFPPLPDNYVYYKCTGSAESWHFSSDATPNEANACLTNINPAIKTSSDNIFIVKNGNFIKIEMPFSIIHECRVTIYDITGRGVISELFNGQIFSLDLTQLTKGVYLVCVQTGKTIKTKKIQVS